MKCNLPPKVVVRRGITLIELTVIILVLLMLITIVFMSGRAWKRGSDRAACVLNLRNCQMAARSYQNIHGYRTGGQPDLRYGTRDIARHLVENGYITRSLYDQAKGMRPCPGGGAYNSSAPDVFPPLGELYLQCSLSSSEAHELESGAIVDW
jgi:type II secretory pathway pseudopilin PulG